MRILTTLAAACIALAAPMLASAETPTAAPAPAGVKNIIIVHDAFTDGSGWRTVEDILSHKGYNVRVVQEPLTNYYEDVGAVRAATLAAVGPVVLVGHGYGGEVITAAGARAKVKALVYVAAYQPDVLESVTQLVSSMPTPSNDWVTLRDGHIVFNQANYAADFAGDVAPERTEFMAVSQVPATVAAFGAAPFEVAWHDHQSYSIVATQDRALSPDLQRWMAARAHSKVTEIAASHSVEISQPEAVAQVIENAALNAH
jgi:pimeloyl-ACP methyl ester carboxylesterase